MFEMPEFKSNMQKVFETQTITAIGAIEGTFRLNMVTDDIDQAIKDVKYIILLTPAFAHGNYARLLKGKVTEDQVIVTIPGSFASLKFKKIFGDAPCPTFVDANNLMYDTRLEGPGKVNIFELDTIELGFLPVEKETELIDELKGMFDISGVFHDVLECGLAIVNPCLHTGPCLLNIGSIENRTIDFYLYEHGFTASASKVDLKLDQERKAIAKAFGYDVNPFKCFPYIRMLEERGEEYAWYDLYRSCHGDYGLTPVQGPNDIMSRYMTEDAPCGLVPWTYLAKAAGVKTPVIDSVLNIYSIVHDTDWRKEGVTLEELGLDGKSVEEISAYCKG